MVILYKILIHILFNFTRKKVMLGVSFNNLYILGCLPKNYIFALMKYFEDLKMGFC